MNALWTVAEIVAATGGRVDGLSDVPVGSVSIDSREVDPGALFVAIKGETHDGHAFVGKALEQGAAAALVSTVQPDAPADRRIVVKDTLRALEMLGQAARSRNRGQIVAVTGSAGKTTTKEAIRSVLAAAGQTHYSIKSFNNHWGVPLMLARMPREAQFGVFEIGMNHAGEITPLTRLVRPHIAVITTVAAAHLEFFKSVAEIAAAKAEIFLGLEPGGTALLNADHDYLHILLAHARAAGVGRVLTYGFDEAADWRITDVRQQGEQTIANVLHDGQTHTLELKVPGRHMVANAVAALAVAQLSGEGTDVATRALAGFGAPEGRGLTLRLGPAAKPLLLVDESYNANVASMRASLDLYAAVQPPSGRKVLILGDMLEMGPQGPTLHAGLADAVLATGANRIALIGPVMASLYEELGRRATKVQLSHAASIDEAAENLLAELAYGDAVMVKGSKGVRLAALVQSIRDRFKSA